MESAISNIETACSGTGKPNTRYPQLNADVRSIALLTALAAVGQFASNIYTPSLPFVAAELNITAAQAQSTFGVFLLSFAAMQLVYGPLADRFGRRPVLFTAFTLFLLGTIICAMAATLQILLAGRTVQAAGAAGAASALIVSRAVTRDRFDGIELQKS
ncbi:MFS transporter [Candidatus Halocynthiibacter alkanivorans]|uniref:MFS transporter n=1 Tax=Candidatus Halocynthiibacter alkanivorans TaxID=2267619 RepID=UPI0013568903|nr:MFS transporter [Candidatus Halocynthiibacter alkanivorans]